MKKLNFLKYAVALCVSAFCLMFLPLSADAAEVNDTKNGVTYADEIYIASNIASEWSYGGAGYINVRLSEEGDRVKNVKSKSKNVIAKVTAESYTSYVNDGKTTTRYSQASISFFGKKKGTYKVTFDVVNADGVKKCTKTIKVHVNKYSPATVSPIKSVKYAGKDIASYEPFATAKKGKLKVTVNKGFKIKSIHVKKKNSKGEWVPTKVKNGRTITLSKRNKYTYKDEWSTIKTNALFPETQIEVTVKNKKTKELTTHVYSIYTINKK